MSLTQDSSIPQLEALLVHGSSPPVEVTTPFAVFVSAQAVQYLSQFVGMGESEDWIFDLMCCERSKLNGDVRSRAAYLLIYLDELEHEKFGACTPA